MRKGFSILTMAAAAWIALADYAHAGMPSLTLTDVARLRLQNISFFLAGFFLCALFIQLLWNGLRRDWSVLPRLTYPKALGIVFLWGLLFVLVLTMISGARELMTPGAWEKQGLTYKLAAPTEATPGSPGHESLDNKRELQLSRLRAGLWKYADGNGGVFPPDLSIPEIAEEDRMVPDPAASAYVYVTGLKAGQGAVPLVYEPEVFGGRRLVLLANGEIRWMESAELGQFTSVQP